MEVCSASSGQPFWISLPQLSGANIYLSSRHSFLWDPVCSIKKSLTLSQALCCYIWGMDWKMEMEWKLSFKLYLVHVFPASAWSLSVEGCLFRCLLEMGPWEMDFYRDWVTHVELEAQICQLCVSKGNTLHHTPMGNCHSHEFMSYPLQWGPSADLCSDTCLLKSLGDISRYMWTSASPHTASLSRCRCPLALGQWQHIGRTSVLYEKPGCSWSQQNVWWICNKARPLNAVVKELFCPLYPTLSTCRANSSVLSDKWLVFWLSVSHPAHSDTRGTVCAYAHVCTCRKSCRLPSASFQVASWPAVLGGTFSFTFWLGSHNLFHSCLVSTPAFPNELRAVSCPVLFGPGKLSHWGHSQEDDLVP